MEEDGEIVTCLRGHMSSSSDQSELESSKVNLQGPQVKTQVLRLHG